jgi:hypothetical protein
MKMKRFTILGAAVALLVAGAPAFAFKETPVGKSGAGPSAEGSAASGAGQGAAGFSTDSGSAGNSKGLDVRIPGLGKLGVLPKLDFGLDILYGATETQRTQPTPGPSVGEDGMTIQGRIKHKF